MGICPRTARTVRRAFLQGADRYGIVSVPVPANRKRRLRSVRGAGAGTHPRVPTLPGTYLPRYLAPWVPTSLGTYPRGLGV